ncbi:MAG: type II toxin-antitoxin system VapC family toxin [Candidatus Nezhaarchaeales archaeon]|uniref:PIN domain-containing protein n=1 Tax=Staphylothermus marinus TaxID=2280 RepID=A0A7J3KGX1_STAMA
MTVVDASALIAFLLREEGWRSIARYMVQTMSVDHVLKEFYNALWKSISVRRYVDPSYTVKILDLLHSYVDKNMLIEPEELYLDKALEIALNYSITVYDALYIAQALHHNKPLLTLDQKQREVASKLGIKCIP